MWTACLAGSFALTPRRTFVTERARSAAEVGDRPDGLQRARAVPSGALRCGSVPDAGRDKEQAGLRREYTSENVRLCFFVTR